MPQFGAAMQNENRKNSLFQRSPILTIGAIIVLLLILSEIIFRVAFWVKGYEVGKLAPNWEAFEEVDSLMLTQQFYTDDKGIYKALPKYWTDYGYPLNRENFRGNEFDTANTKGKVRVLHIGDSFTWGANAKPIDSCFVDLMDNQPDLVCYNAGIPGTDPAQYLLVAQSYVPLLKPDVTIVNFYLANDLMEEERTITPGRNLYYQTNAGWLPATHQNHYFASAAESYQFIKDKYVLINPITKLMAKTALGTAILIFPMRWEEYTTWKAKKAGDVPNGYLKKIQRVCENNESRLLIFVIPSAIADLKENEYQRNPKQYVLTAYPNLFIGLETNTFVLPMKEAHYYPNPDGHFNNEGHRVAAKYMLENL